MSDIPAKARRDLAKRDECCARCGAEATDIHHRTRRRDGGHALSNMVRLCRLCHQWVHAHPKAARRFGFIIPALRRPPLDSTTIPCLGIRTEGGSAWFLLDDNGGRAEIPAALATELLEAAGMLSDERAVA